MYQDKRVAVIIAAAGSGTRMGGGISKQYIRIGSEMVLEKALKNFGEHPLIDDIYLVVKKEDMEFCRKEFVETRKLPKIRAILSGGVHRQSSVYNGLKIASGLRPLEGKPANPVPTPDYILVHDGARPFVSKEEISRLVDAVSETGAATLGTPVKDTIARVEGLRIKENLDRSCLYSIQTPQGFLFTLLLYAHKKARNDGFIGTDDAGLVQRLGSQVALVSGSYDNIKITTPEDLRFAGGPGIDQRTKAGALEYRSQPDLRTGTGLDVHAFAENRPLVLGGVRIPWGQGLMGHSDADVLTHAIMDALLGACGLGDIGEHFPDKDPKYKDISSLSLLGEVNAAVKGEGFRLGNIDATVVAEKPRLSPYIKEMESAIAHVLGIESNRINIKATTTERLGFCGREEGIAAIASATVKR